MKQLYGEKDIALELMTHKCNLYYIINLYNIEQNYKTSIILNAGLPIFLLYII